MPVSQQSIHQRTRSLLPGLKSLDMFGFKPALLYRGSGSFTTVAGAVASLILFSLMLINLVQLATKFVNGSGQTDSYQLLYFDRYASEPFVFSENRIQLSVVTETEVPSEWQLVAL